MNSNSFKALIWFLFFLCVGVAYTSPALAGEPPVKTFLIEARQYAYDPPVIRVNKGDEVHIRLRSKDVTHGFYLEGHNIDARIEAERETFWLKNKEGPAKEVEEIVFIANRTGKFRYRCSNTCGYLHPFMLGEMIVSPNYLYRGSVGGACLLVLGMLARVFWKKRECQEDS